MNPGVRLGPYEIVARLGAGGMGEVWRARDTRLEREVAVKILPAEFAHDATLRLRFEREAKTISQLNHPHICTLHDIGRENGTDYLVMELIDGESLADRLAKGPLPLADVLRYGVQIAEALDRAHRAGIVHRDLKPGNVMLTRSGAKLLDFGLAKPAAAATPLSGASFLTGETHQKPLTQEGLIVGTFQYMAPEQLEGFEADARTDIFAFGTLLYEMLTGRRAFAGRTRTSLIAAIVSAEPAPVAALQPLTPPPLEHLIQRCLRKEPDERWQTARDVAEELKWIAAAGSQAGVAPAASRARRRVSMRALALPAVLVALLIAVGAAALRWRAEAARSSAVLRFSVHPPGGTTVQHGGGVSPDGRFILWTGVTGGVWEIWRYSFEEGVSRRVEGTEGGAGAFWSPDQKWIGFFERGKLKRIAASGGSAQVICDAPAPRGAAWNADGRIVFAPMVSGPLQVVAATGGTPRDVTSLDSAQQERHHRFPSFLPDGKHFLYFALGREGAIWAASIEGGPRKQLVRADSSGTYVDGWLLYVRDRTLFAQRFDPESLNLSGDPQPLMQSTRAFSASTHVITAWQGAAGDHQLAWYDQTGKRLGTLGAPGAWDHPRISPDGRLAAADRTAESSPADIWIFDLLRGTMSRFTSDTGNDWIPAWSPDGRRIAFQASVGASSELRVKQTNGAGTTTLVAASKDRQHHTDWSADGRFVVQERSAGATKSDIWFVDLETGASRPLLRSEFNERLPRISPDGRWLAYASDETGRSELYIAELSGSGRKWQISIDGGTGSAWRHDGKELYFLDRRKMMAVTFEPAGSEVEIGAPRVLFDASPSNDHAFDVSRDGRFLIASVGDVATDSPINVVVNWRRLLDE